MLAYTLLVSRKMIYPTGKDNVFLKITIWQGTGKMVNFQDMVNKILINLHQPILDSFLWGENMEQENLMMEITNLSGILYKIKKTGMERRCILMEAHISGNGRKIKQTGQANINPSMNLIFSVDIGQITSFNQINLAKINQVVRLKMI